VRVCVHRGAREIGGNCVELEVAGKRLVIDVGRPREASLDDHVELPDIAGLAAAGDGSLVGRGALPVPPRLWPWAALTRVPPAKASRGLPLGTRVPTGGRGRLE
jgi:ribonuclease J